MLIMFIEVYKLWSSFEEAGDCEIGPKRTQFYSVSPMHRETEYF
jgi:hypothetical protein